jgi:hypothetical protein
MVARSASPYNTREVQEDSGGELRVEEALLPSEELRGTKLLLRGKEKERPEPLLFMKDEMIARSAADEAAGRLRTKDTVERKLDEVLRLESRRIAGDVVDE